MFIYAAVIMLFEGAPEREINISEISIFTEIIGQKWFYKEKEPDNKFIRIPEVQPDVPEVLQNYDLVVVKSNCFLIAKGTLRLFQASSCNSSLYLVIYRS